MEAADGQQLCVVCHDVANGVHFGIVSCEGCKVRSLPICVTLGQWSTNDSSFQQNHVHQISFFFFIHSFNFFDVDMYFSVGAPSLLQLL